MIANFDTAGYNPLKAFKPKDLFENDSVYSEVAATLYMIAENQSKLDEKNSNDQVTIQNGEVTLSRSYSLFDMKLSHFVLWISTLLSTLR